MCYKVQITYRMDKGVTRFKDRARHHCCTRCTRKDPTGNSIQPRMVKPKQRQQPIKKRTITEENEEKLEKARQAYESHHYCSIRATANAHDVPYFTLRRRILGLALPKKEAHINQQLLNKAEQATLIDWIKYLALTGHPLNKRTIRPKVQAILEAKGRKVDSKHPLKTWIHDFIKRHTPELKMGRGSGLDPKHAKAFNFVTVQGHFKLFKETIEKNNILWRNIHNMDEKGIQMGGGRNGTCTKYFFGQDDKIYKLQSDELQLVTVIDSVCADGTANIGPGFVFPGSTKHKEWFEEPGIKYL